MKTKNNRNEVYDYRERFDSKYGILFEECTNNINSLVQEAKLLFENGFYARSFMISYTALEELGKRLIVADYINDIVSESELKRAFYNHEIKLAYLHNNANLIKNDTGSYDAEIVYDLDKYGKWLKERNKSLYVDFRENEIKSPIKEITKEYAQKILNYVYKIIKDTNFYEGFNGRIGSKAIYK